MKSKLILGLLSLFMVLAVVKAEAEKKVVAAQAEAEANKLRTQALTPMILKQQWIDKWDGSLPTLFKGIE